MPRVPSGFANPKGFVAAALGDAGEVHAHHSASLSVVDGLAVVSTASRRAG